MGVNRKELLEKRVILFDHFRGHADRVDAARVWYDWNMAHVRNRLKDCPEFDIPNSTPIPPIDLYHHETWTGHEWRWFKDHGGLLKVRKKRSYSHIRLDSLDHNLNCYHCGDIYPFNRCLPAPVEIALAITTAFAKIHNKCSPSPQGIALERDFDARWDEYIKINPPSSSDTPL